MKKKKEQKGTSLTLDEIAAICLYTLETPLYSALNQRLREPKRERLRPYLPYIKLLLNGLYKLPIVSSETVFRGVKGNMILDYKVGDKKIWWSFSSTTTSLNVLQNEQFLGKEGERTKFTIKVFCGFNISRFSLFSEEEEVLLIPGTSLEVIGILDLNNGLHEIQMRQMDNKGMIDFPPPSSPFPSLPPSPSFSPSWKAQKPKKKFFPFSNSWKGKKHSFQNPKSSNLGSQKAGSSKLLEKKTSSSPKILVYSFLGLVLLAFFGFFSRSSSSTSVTRDYTSVGELVRQFSASTRGGLVSLDPRSMAIDKKERIFVADTSNHIIQCFDSKGQLLFKFGSKGAENGAFKEPFDVAFDSKNQRILVADSANHRIQAFDLRGKFLFSFGRNGKGPGQFDRPLGIAVNQEGNIYVSDSINDRVQVFDEKGSFLHQFGFPGSEKGKVARPLGIGILSNGDVIVAEHGSQRISIFRPNGQFVRFVGEGTLKSPERLFIDSQDNILVADNWSLLIFSSSGTEIKQVGLGTLKKALSVVMNRKGEIFVSGRGNDDQPGIFVF